MKVVVSLKTKVLAGTTIETLFYDNVDSIVVLVPRDIRLYFDDGQQTTFYGDELIKIEVLF